MLTLVLENVTRTTHDDESYTRPHLHSPNPEKQL